MSPPRGDFSGRGNALRAAESIELEPHQGVDLYRRCPDPAKKPPACIESIVAHEMAHLPEPTHNARFSSLMSLFLPQWQQLRETLNRLPMRHEVWRY
ncbi:M48 family metallopeptidase [Ralstonia pseudosolanacearum]|uniref:M48 metallopeptidase family protein n=1 Tax=Ralstonia pseudosolanacearum TaxID=1310165 RepID=UPI00399D612C